MAHDATSTASSRRASQRHTQLSGWPRLAGEAGARRASSSHLRWRYEFFARHEDAEAAYFQAATGHVSLRRPMLWLRDCWPMIGYDDISHCLPALERLRLSISLLADVFYLLGRP